MSLSRKDTWHRFFQLVESITGKDKLFVMSTPPHEAPYPTSVIVARPAHLEPAYPDPRYPHFKAGTLGLMIFTPGPNGTFVRFEGDRSDFTTIELEAAVRHAYDTYLERQMDHDVNSHRFRESDSYINIDD